jgi:formimidoylglutamate deiminase
MEILWANKALTKNGWQSDVSVSIGEDGYILSVEPNRPAEGKRVGVLLASPVNLHSHAFQRAMA